MPEVKAPWRLLDTTKILCYSSVLHSSSVLEALGGLLCQTAFVLIRLHPTCCVTSPGQTCLTQLKSLLAVVPFAPANVLHARCLGCVQVPSVADA